jgi:hypothetical protein
MHYWFRLILSLGLLALLILPAGVAAAPPTTATMVFGKELGQRPPTQRNPPCTPGIPPGPPACFPPDHDNSANAADDIVPRTAVITAGASSVVSFIRAVGNHGVAVYAPGTDVRALQADPGVAGSGFFDVDNATFDRVYEGPLEGNAWPVGPTGAQTTPAGTFTAPGRYLVVCTFKPHFRDTNMYAWINVH